MVISLWVMAANPMKATDLNHVGQAAVVGAAE